MTPRINQRASCNSMDILAGNGWERELELMRGKIGKGQSPGKINSCELYSIRPNVGCNRLQVRRRAASDVLQTLAQHDALVGILDQTLQT